MSTCFVLTNSTAFTCTCGVRIEEGGHFDTAAGKLCCAACCACNRKPLAPGEIKPIEGEQETLFHED